MIPKTCFGYDDCRSIWVLHTVVKIIARIALESLKNRFRSRLHRPADQFGTVCRFSTSTLAALHWLPKSFRQRQKGVYLEYSKMSFVALTEVSGKFEIPSEIRLRLVIINASHHRWRSLCCFSQRTWRSSMGYVAFPKKLIVSPSPAM